MIILLPYWYFAVGGIMSEPERISLPISSEIENLAQQKGLVVVEEGDIGALTNVVTAKSRQDFVGEAEQEKLKIRYASYSIGGNAIKQYVAFSPTKATYRWEDKYPDRIHNNLPRLSAKYDFETFSGSSIVYKKDLLGSVGWIGIVVPIIVAVVIWVSGLFTGNIDFGAFLRKKMKKNAL